MNWEDHNPIEWQAATRPARWYEWLLILLLLGLAGGVRAAPIHKCTDPHGAIAYQQLPCPTGAQENPVEIAPAPAYAKSPEYALDRQPAPPATRVSRVSRREPQALSFECRTADSQVFYRHTSCPHSVASSSGNAPTSRGGRGGSSSTSVSSTRVPRDEACSRIHSAGAIGRAGHQHDEDVSTYDRNLGRDPCR
jgi:hypothetical protein